MLQRLAVAVACDGIRHAETDAIRFHDGAEVCFAPAPAREEPLVEQVQEARVGDGALVRDLKLDALLGVELVPPCFELIFDVAALTG